MRQASDSHRQRALQTRTRAPSESGRSQETVRFLLLTIAWHADVSRVGECAWLPPLEVGETFALSRIEPDFLPVDGDGTPRPIAEPTVSRRPLLLKQEPSGIRLSLESGSSSVTVNGVPLGGEELLSEPDLDQGVLVGLGGRVLLVLRRQAPTVTRPPHFGLIGESPAMLDLRRSIQSAADLSVPVLIRGESGTGKELVAKAIQAHSDRRSEPFQTINMAAVPASLAASELFGAAKGAFSSADRQRHGYFERTHRGTLFLDEIGETPREVQGLLLRVLENGEIQPVGAGQPRQVDVRVLTATDADLEARVEEGDFSQALLQRLGGLRIQLPPLRRRKEDVGRLLLHFLRQELRHIGREDVLDYTGLFTKPFVSARLVLRMTMHAWPGNVRELRNEVRQLVIASRRSEHLLGEHWQETREPSDLSPEQTREPASSPPRPIPEPKQRPKYRDPSDPSDDELVQALEEHEWNLKACAEALGISRASLYGRIRNHPDIRPASELEREAIETALSQSQHSLSMAARLLRVSRQGLKRRMKTLDIKKEKL